jgi:two-component system sensor histidine kinase SenX3
LEVHEDGFVIVDHRGSTLMKNAVAQRFLGLEFGGRSIAATLGFSLDTALRGLPSDDELELVGPTNQTVAVHARPLVSEGGVVGALAWIRDISETRRTEQVRRDFVANVSHELKTPIGALTVLAETMAVAGDPVVQQQLAERVVREADRLARIIEDLLDLSLLDSREEPPREELPLASLVTESLDRVRPKADAAGIPLVAHGLSSNERVACDRRQLTSAITNLLDNAIKYSDPGAEVEVEFWVRGDDLEVVVRDHGLGIPSEELERIFERFYRVDRARSRDTGGTGLGLAIVRHVAQAHGGEVVVRSQEGEGSEFVLRLPRLVARDDVVILATLEELDV